MRARFQVKKPRWKTLLTISRSTQSSFRFRLAVRDGFCIVSEDEEPVAAHILPQSRPEVCTVMDILQCHPLISELPWFSVLRRSFRLSTRPPVWSQLWTVFGIFPSPLFWQRRVGTFSRSLCKYLDRDSLRLLLTHMLNSQDASNLIVHVFYGAKRKVWHGKKIPRSRFRIAHESQLPDRRLLNFHYQQCIIKHIRGVSLYWFSFIFWFQDEGIKALTWMRA